MRLKYVQIDTDFRKSELTNFNELCTTRNGKEIVRSLGGNDVVCFVSKGRDQVIFVHGFEALERRNSKGEWAGGTIVLRSTRWRLPSNSEWNPFMLGNYAKLAGIKLDGIKLFEEHYKELIERKRPAGGLKATAYEAVGHA